MTPVVAVIAPGAMGAAVGQRLADNGLKVLTSLDGRSAETAARAKAAGMAAASDDEIAAVRFHSLDPAAGRRAVACRAFRAGARQEQCQAGLCRLQCHQSEDGRARRRGHRADRLPVRRCRHHRPAAEAGGAGEAAAEPDALLCLGSGRAALRERCAITASTFACSTAPLSAASALKMSYAGHHQGHAGDRRGDDAGGGARRHRRRAVRGIATEPEGNARLVQAAARRRCRPRPIAGSPKCRRSRALSATIRRRASSTKAPRDFYERFAEDFAADKKDAAALAAFLE